MPSAPPVRDVVIAGGGPVAWSAAAAVRRHLPDMAVTVIASLPPPDALADRAGSTLPSIVGFHGDLGLSEANAVGRTGSGYRLGTEFAGWTGDGASYIHSYSEHGRPFGTTSFHLYWISLARRGGVGPFDGFSPAAALAGANRFVHPRDEPGSPLAAFEYGLQLNPAAYLDLMRALALHVGAQERRADVAGVDIAPENGFVRGLHLSDGGFVSADLFIDCTGPAARIRSALEGRFEDWSQYLPCDRILFADGPPLAEPPVLDRALAIGAGWRWYAASPARSSHGLVYSSAHIGDDEAAAALGSAVAPHPVSVRSGRRADPWLRNCVAIGDSAVGIEPLEWTNLHLAHSAIDRMVAMMPDRDFAAIELAEYNRQSQAEAERVRDFVMLHYATARRPEPFWRDAAAAPLPHSLARTLSLFRERGRLPFHEEETFSRDSWLAVLLGQGVVPRRDDPLTDLVPPEHAASAMAQMQDAIRRMLPALPTHGAFLDHLMRQTRR